MEIDAPTRTRLNLEDGAFEKKVNEVLLMGLAKTIIREGLSNEFAAGFKSALLLRSSLKDKKELK